MRCRQPCRQTGTHKMNTPICNFAEQYRKADMVRMHMPGHKGVPLTGPEARDITEIPGADELYRARGIIRESEENAAVLFGTGRTVYSAEGSSLCIRAMLYLAALRAKEQGLPMCLLAGRNAHRTLMTAAAALDLEVDWIFPAEGEGLLSCRISPEVLEERLNRGNYMAVYVTSPDYTGNMADIRALAGVCRRKGVPLLVDNAHGAYLKFLAEDLHPVTLGADMACDSAHKTLSCLTGAAYLHISREAPAGWAEQAERAMAFFASTSPSYLILQSLDRMNAELAGSWPERLRQAVIRLDVLREDLRQDGWKITGSEPMKLTFAARERGLTGIRLAEILQAQGIACEFADPDFTVLMPSPETTARDLERLMQALHGIPKLDPLPGKLLSVRIPERVCSIRQAMLSPREEIPVELAEGRVLADPCAGCPPAVPVLIAGERIDAGAVRCFRYYGTETCMVMK